MVARNRLLCTMVRSASFAVVTDQKTSKGGYMGYMGIHLLCLSPGLAQSSQNKDRSVPEDITLVVSWWFLVRLNW